MIILKILGYILGFVGLMCMAQITQFKRPKAQRDPIKDRLKMLIIGIPMFIAALVLLEISGAIDMFESF